MDLIATAHHMIDGSSGARWRPRGVESGRSIGLLGAVLSACSNPARDEAILNTHGHPDRGQSAIEHYGYSTCHTIPGISGPDVLVGPRLDHVAKQAYIAGVLTNTPDNLIRWIEHPTHVDSLTAMTDLGVTPDDARDIAAYPYSR